MIGLGLRLSLKGGREAGARLAFTALGVALGVALLLTTLAGFNGLKATDARDGWLTTGEHNRRPSVNEATSDPLWWRLLFDRYGDRDFMRLEVAATGPRSPLPPGVPRMPRAGEYYVSPALARLLAQTPANVLGDRLAGHQVGVLGRQALTSPDALVAVVGRPAAELSHAGGAMKVSSIEAAPREHSYSEYLRIVLGLGAIGLLAPVLVFVATSTRLAAARREERFAALRLVGATPKQVNAIASVESGLAAIAGMLAGFGLFWVFRPLVARIPFTGHPFFTSDLSLGWLAVTCVVLGVPLAAVAASLLTLRRVRISPLGVMRRVTPRPPRARRLVLVILGLGILVAARFADGSDAGLYAILGAFTVIIIGLMVAGPWLTMVGARLLAKLARRDSTLIAGRRLADDPAKAFRAISGLVLAVFVGSVFIGVVGSAIARDGGLSDTLLPAGSVSVWLDSSSGGDLAASAAKPLLAHLHGLDGVRAVIPVRAPSAEPTENAGLGGLAAASDLGRLGVRGRAAGAGGTVRVEINQILWGVSGPKKWPAAKTPAGGLDRLRLRALVVTTDGRRDSIERVRTAIESALPGGFASVIVSELDSESMQMVGMLQRMVDVGIILSLVIAGCSLAVSVAGGLIERKRPFSLLRLTGMPLAHLRRVVLLEAAVPLMLVALVSAAAGLLAADLILRATPNGFGLAAPGPGYYAIMGGGLVAALGVVCATLPLLGRVTELQSVRTE